MSDRSGLSWTSRTFGVLTKRLVNGGTPPTHISAYWSGTIPWITGADFTPSGLSEFRRYVSEDAVAHTATNVIAEGELLLVTRTGVGKLAIAPCDVAISQDVTGAYADRSQVDVGFLFHRMRQTETLIAKTQQIRAGLMHDLFTRGVTPDGQLRPSREEAPKLYKESPLGWIPKEWETSRLQKIAAVRTGIAKNESRVFSKPIVVQYLRVANVQDGFLDLSEMKTIQVEAADLERYQVLIGDVLMNEGGDLDKLGRGAVWFGSSEPCVHQNHVFVVRCGPDIVPAFLNAWTATPTARRYFMVAGKQTTNLASINKTQLGRLPVPVLSPQEQSLIVHGMEAIDARIEADSQANAKLRLLKVGLMHDLLDGRVRVPVEEPREVAI